MSAYPYEPGARDTDTSRDAAVAMRPHAGRLQRLVMEAVRNAGSAGLTSEECARTLRMECAAIQPRTTELRQLGRIRDSGLRRLNASGKRAIVWTTGA